MNANPIPERERAEQSLAEAVRQQEALYQFADQLYRSKSLGDVCEAALQGICSALQCERASILLLDRSGVMRFVAWRGLSEVYRNAVKGHSPWKADDPDPQPVCVNDIAAAPVDDSLRAVVVNEGIRALAFIPLMSQGKLIGKFMIYFNAPHLVTEEEIELALTIARQLAFGIERRRAEESLRRKADQQRMLSEALAHLLATDDPEKIVRELYPKVAAHLGVDAYFNYMVNEKGDALQLHSCGGISEETMRQIRRLEFGQAICGTVAQTLRPIVAMDIQNSDYDKAALVRGFGIQAYACNPLMSGNRLLGTLSFASRSRSYFEEAELEFLRLISSYVAVAMERARTRQELRESEERLRLMADNTPAMISYVDRDEHYRFNNARYQEWFGIEPEQVTGRHIRDVLGEDVYRQRLPYIEQVLRGETVRFEGPTRHHRLGLRDTELVYVPDIGSDERVRGFYVMAFDITKRKRAEEDLTRLNIELENKVVERTAALQQANAALLRDMEERKKLQEELLQAQKMQSIGTLAGGIAHDFNNILNIILGYTLLLKHGSSEENLSDALGVIEETVQRGAALSQQLLTVARKTAINFQGVDVNTILQKLKLLLSETFPKTIEIFMELDPDIPPLIADPNQIHQALLNLCVNARDAMPGGGKILLEISIVAGAELRRSFQEAREERYVSILVADTGTGIDEVTKSRIFEPFFTTKPQGQGTGLGLSVVYGIIANHSGFVNVESAPGRGTTFRIYLPILCEKVESLEAEPQVEGRKAKDPVGRGETILFVDDEDKQLSLMRKFLEGEGFRVLTARDGAEAVDTYLGHKEEIAAVILDLGLPKFNGWEALQRMRKIRPDLKALFATGFLSPEIEGELARGEISGIIMKPYQLDEVVKKISDALQSPPPEQTRVPA